MERLPVYRCCGEQFEDLSHLQVHLCQHFDGRSLYKCTVEGCRGDSTNQRSSFMRHLKQDHRFLYQLLNVHYNVPIRYVKLENEAATAQQESDDDYQAD